MCCDAYWGVAESSDGIHFELISLNETGAPHLRPTRRSLAAETLASGNKGVINPKDGNAVLIDDDGVGYIAYTAISPSTSLHGSRPPGFKGDHMVAIERLTPDLLHSTKIQVYESNCSGRQLQIVHDQPHNSRG